MHVQESGAGGPVVVLEAGIAASSLSWSLVQPEVARFTRVLSYDRAGLGWSYPSSAPRTCAQSVEELRALLQAAHLPPPYVLVGHSFGGCVVRLYASRYPDEVAGLILVDALHPDEWREPTAQQRRMLKGGALFSLFGALLARLGVVRLCLALLTSGRTWFPRLFARSLGSGVSGVTGRIVGEVRKLPQEVWPAVSALWCLPKCFRSMASHVRWLAESSQQAAAANGLAHKPLVVLTKGNAHPLEVVAQEGVARLSSRGKHLLAAKSGHWIHLDQPDLVVHAIHEVVEAVRREERAAAVRWVM
jgi:pimeloyl-ACP methyl ester carboxylesterase